MRLIVPYLKDRDRAQRGSVLSGVLIITAFLAIISGALMTELSTNFLLSRDISARVVAEATLKSSLEVAVDSIQNAPFNSACPGLAQAPVLNGMSTSISYLYCAMTGTPESISQSAPITVDGSYASLSGQSPWKDEYLVVDSQGTLFAYPFGQPTGASYALGGTPTAPPVAVTSGGTVVYLVPIEYSGPTTDGVATVVETAPGQGSAQCTMATSDRVLSSAASGRNVTGVAYVGNRSGNLYAFASTGTCAPLQSINASNDPIVAGPLVFPGSSNNRDRVFVIASDGDSSVLLQYRYSGNTRSFSLMSTLTLPAASAVGMASDSTTLPARLAITFAGGRVAIVQVSASFNMTLQSPTAVGPSGVADPPVWCLSCQPGGLIGVAGQGGLYVFDQNLNVFATFTGAQFTTAPVADAGGDWFAAAGGALYEFRPTAPSMTAGNVFQITSSSIQSSPVLNPCSRGLCAYFGSSDGHAYLIPMDTHLAALTACITVGGSCSNASPKLWAQIQVGGPAGPQAVQVMGFSYYST